MTYALKQSVCVRPKKKPECSWWLPTGSIQPQWVNPLWACKMFLGQTVLTGLFPVGILRAIKVDILGGEIT
jgi:hypothetical protein